MSGGEPEARAEPSTECGKLTGESRSQPRGYDQGGARDHETCSFISNLTPGEGDHYSRQVVVSVIFCICRGGPRREEQSSSSVKFCSVPVLRSTPARRLVYTRHRVGVWSSIPAAPFLCDNFVSMRRRGFTGLVPQTFACTVKSLHAVAFSFVASADGGNTPLGSHAPVYVFATPRGSPSLAPLFSSPIRGHHTVLRVPVPFLTQHHR
jgi:hypothetical protein